MPLDGCPASDSDGEVRGSRHALQSGPCPMSDGHDTAPASGRVVVVEDDPLQAESLAFILRQEGYVVELASTGAEALAVARSQPAPDTVLLDVALPDLSGVEVARRRRASAPRFGVDRRAAAPPRPPGTGCTPSVGCASTRACGV